MLNVPTLATRFCGMLALNCDPLRKLVDNGAPAHRILDPLRNPVPVTSSEKPAEPTVTLFGLRVEMFGTAVLIVKLRMFEKTPPGFNTCTLALPGIEIKLAVTVAVNCPELTKVV